MNDLPTLFPAAAAGGLLGGVFFGSLWWTVRQALRSTQPALWFLVSLLLRTSIAVGGFYALGHGDWKRLVACLVGFVVARLVVMRLTRASDPRRAGRGQEAVHAAKS